MKALKRGAATLVVAYALWCGALMALETPLFFPGAGRGPQPPIPADARLERVTHPDGVETELVVLPAPAPNAPVLVFLHGNGSNVGTDAHYVGHYRSHGYTVVLPEYRGYGGSGGTPSEASITADLVRVVDSLPDRIGSGPIVYFGRSIGACFAAQLAARRPPTAMILQTPFLRTDVRALDYLAPPFLVSNAFRADRVMPGFDFPVLLIKHARDGLAPPEDADALHALGPNTQLVTLDAGHNDSGPPADMAREQAAIAAVLVAARGGE